MPDTLVVRTDGVSHAQDGGSASRRRLSRSPARRPARRHRRVDPRRSRRAMAKRCAGSSTICRRNRGGAASSRRPNPLTRSSHRLADAHDPDRALTLVVDRYVDGGSARARGDCVRLPSASYLGIDDGVAEVAFAVDDRFQGKGLGTMLLERLAAIAAQHGFERFEAIDACPTTRRCSRCSAIPGSRSDRRSARRGRPAAVADAVRRAACARPRSGDRAATAASLRPLLAPRGGRGHRRVARSRAASAGACSTRCRAAGFTGPVYPVNPERRPKSTACPAIARSRDAAGRHRSRRRRGAEPAGRSTSSTNAPPPASSRWSSSRAGFAEIGDAGRALQQQLVETVRGYGMRMVGPNCMGLLNTAPDVRLNASFSPILPPPGRIAFSSQSGALGLAILELARQRGVGLSTFVSVGNKADVSGNDLLQYWEADPATGVILLYLESFGNPRRFAPHRAPDRPDEADRRGQGRPDAGRVARGRQPHRRARRQRRRGRCAVPAVGRHPRRHDRRDVRHRGVPRRAAAARRPARGDRHQRRRSGHPRGRRVRSGRPDVSPSSPKRHASALARLPAAGSERRQSGRHGGVGRAGRVPAGRSRWR